MKKSIQNLIIALLATTALSNCGGDNKPSQTTTNDTIDSIVSKEATLKFEDFKAGETFKKGYTNITVSYPTEGPEALVKNIREFINKSLGGTYKGDLCNAQDMVNHYAKSKLDSLKSGFDSEEELDELDQELCSTDSIFLNYEGKNYITIVHTGYEETGGPHGYGYAEGATFSKKNGQRFTKELMTGLNTPEFNQIVKEGLKDYFSQGKGMSDEDLEEDLMIEDGVDLKHLPLPQAEPYFDNKGIVFGYASYEIACYAEGHPEFVIPFDKAKKFLKAEALEMIE